MDSLTENFNAQAYWSIYIAPLLMLLILDDIARREKRRNKRILKLDREFNAKAMKQSRDRYRRQVGLPPYRPSAPRP